MIHVGKKQVLKVFHEDKSGFYLQDDEDDEVFLPGTLAADGLKKDQEAEVFVYTDNNGDRIATMTMPFGEVGDILCLKVKDIANQGAYMDFGLPKDLLVPKSLQQHQMKKGEVHLIKVSLEVETERLFASAKFNLPSATGKLKHNQSVKVIPHYKSPMGYKCLVEGQYAGMVYHNELFAKVVPGVEIEGTVKQVRTDGQVDCLLGKTGLSAVEVNAEKILQKLQANQGFLALHDKSDPDTIKAQLGLSKKAFKAAVGFLLKRGSIKLSDEGIKHES